VSRWFRPTAPGGRTIRAISFFAVCLFASCGPGFASAEPEPDSVTKYFAARPDLLLCNAYAISRTDSLRKEILERKILNEADFAGLATNAAKAGTSECALLIAYRLPLSIKLVRGDSIPGKPADVMYRFDKNVVGPNPVEVFLKAGTVVEVLEELDVLLR
jgi:hypothetical protein